MAYTLTEKNSVLIFEITRPSIHNAINFEVLEGFEKMADIVRQNDTIKLAVITGQGEKSFCSGGDLSIFHELKTEEESYNMLIGAAKTLYKIATLEVPTIALINGTAVGGGCEIATLCDYRLVKNGAKCGFIQGKLAITTGWGGGSYLLEKGLQHDHAMRMLTEAIPYQSDELLSFGWATQTYTGDKLQALESFIEKMQLPHASVLRAYKKQTIRKWESTGLWERIQEEVKTCSILWEKEEHHQAVESFLSKRK